MVHFENVTKVYKNGVHALNDVSLDIADGEFVYVIGETGSGKSTFIKMINSEEIPTKGKVVVNGINVGALRHSRVPKYRRSLGVVFQDYRLLEQKTVFENIAFAMEVLNKPNTASLSKEDIVKGIELCIEAIVENYDKPELN